MMKLAALDGSTVRSPSRKRALVRKTKKTRTSSKRPYCFVSYAHKDLDTILRFIKIAQSDRPLHWLDQKHLTPGVRWSGDSVAAIRNANGVIVFCSERAFASNDVFREVALAGRFDKPILPVFIDDSSPPDEFLYYLNKHQSIRITDRDAVARFRHALDALVPPDETNETSRHSPSALFSCGAASFVCVLAASLSLWAYSVTGGAVSDTELHAARAATASIGRDVHWPNSAS